MSISNTANFSLYADDTALCTSGKSQVEVMLNFRIELSMIDQWMRANKLTINVNKTKYVVFGTKNQLKDRVDLRLEIGNEPIECVSIFKYLGVVLDESLTFNDHIDFVINKASKKLGIIRKS